MDDPSHGEADPPLLEPFVVDCGLPNRRVVAERFDLRERPEDLAADLLHVRLETFERLCHLGECARVAAYERSEFLEARPDASQGPLSREELQGAIEGLFLQREGGDVPSSCRSDSYPPVALLHPPRDRALPGTR